MIRWLWIPLFLGACSASLDPAVRRPDGGWHVKCGAALERCVKHAEDLCKGRGYVVISGMSRRTLYGAELGMSQAEVREAELDIACADKRGDLPTLTSGGPALPSAAPPASVYAPVVAPPPLAASVTPAPASAPPPSIAPTPSPTPAPLPAPPPAH